jgi:hypothetical protein
MSTDEYTCRFCFEGPYENNPLIDPCDCSGSVKYVHIQCIRTWKLTTTNPLWIDKCQLCLSYYTAYLRWPKEDYPHETPLLHFMVHKHIVLSALLYYAHLTCLSFYPILRPYFGKVDENTIHMSAYTNLEHLYFTRISHMIYLCFLGLVTCMYMYVYKNTLFRTIRNKRLYALLWCSCITDEGLFQTPIMTLCMLCIMFLCSVMYIIPFACFYISILASIYSIHNTIIRQINIRAEII